MFTLKWIDKIAKESGIGLEQLNTRILEALGKRIAKAMGSGGFDRFSVLGEADREADKFYREILNELGRSANTAEEIYITAAKLAYKSANKYYIAKGLEQIPIEYQNAIVNFVKGVAVTTRGTFSNLSNTGAIGYRVMGLDGKVTYRGFKEHYHNLIDQAISEVATGQKSYTSAFRQALKQTADSGIRVLDYESGYSRRLDSAMRQNVIDGVKDIAHEIARQTGEEFGADGVEIDAHNLCALDHLPFQGRQFSKAEFDEIQENLPREFGMWNCRHTYYPIILGVSSPLYTEREREAMIANSTQVRTFEGKEYTAYEATQLQRRIETEMRRCKDRAVLAKAAGDSLTRKVEQLKLNQLKDKYNQITTLFKTPAALDRAAVSGFRPVSVKGIKVPKVEVPEVKQIDFESEKEQVITSFGNQTNYYPDTELGREYAIDLPVIYNEYAAKHLKKDDAHRKRFDWIESNTVDFVRAIRNPEMIEIAMRLRDDGYFSVTNIVKVSNPGVEVWEYLAVAISLSKDKYGNHQITTVHPMRYRDLFYKITGLPKKKYKLTK